MLFSDAARAPGQFCSLQDLGDCAPGNILIQIGESTLKIAAIRWPHDGTTGHLGLQPDGLYLRRERDSRSQQRAGLRSAEGQPAHIPHALHSKTPLTASLLGKNTRRQLTLAAAPATHLASALAFM